MPRSDISDKLIHFTSGVTTEDAFARFQEIVDQRRLIAGNAKIRGRFHCVCFTEAPLASLREGLVNRNAYSRYSPFGVLFEKAYIFRNGGRPVIYQSDAEYDQMPDSLKWRHVRYEPNADPPVDFSWEREWRIRTNALPFEPALAGLVVPDGDWLQRLAEAHDEQQAWRVHEYAMVLNHTLAELHREPFEWDVFRLP